MWMLAAVRMPLDPQNPAKSSRRFLQYRHRGTTAMYQLNLQPGPRLHAYATTQRMVPRTRMLGSIGTGFHKHTLLEQAEANRFAESIQPISVYHSCIRTTGVPYTAQDRSRQVYQCLLIHQVGWSLCRRERRILGPGPIEGSAQTSSIGSKVSPTAAVYSVPPACRSVRCKTSRDRLAGAPLPLPRLQPQEFVLLEHLGA